MWAYQLLLTPPATRSAARRWGVWGGVVALTLATRFALDHWLGAVAPYVVFLPGVFVVAWYGGLRLGLLASALFGVASLSFFLPTRAGGFHLASTRDFVALLLFGFSAVFINLVCAALHRAVAQATDARAEGARQFELIANHSPVLMWVADVAGQSIFFNRAWLQFTGCTLPQERGAGWTDRIHPDDREACLRRREEGFTARQPFRIEYRLRRADGVFRWVMDEGRPRLEASGTFGGFIGSCIDITDTRAEREELAFIARLQTALSSSLEFEEVTNALVQAIVPQLADWCAVDLIGPDGQIEREQTGHHFNPAAAERAHRLNSAHPFAREAPFGADHVARTGKSQLLARVDPAWLQADASTDAPAAAASAGETISYLGVPLRARGTLIGVLSLASGGSGRTLGPADLALAEKIGGIAGFAVDHARLYERTRHAFAAEAAARRQLEISERRFRSIWESDAIGIALLAADGKLSALNRAFARLIGRATNEIDPSATVNWFELATPETREQDRQMWAQMLAAGRCGPFEKEFLLPDGSRRQTLGGSALLPGGEGAVAYALDITAQKEIAAALARSEERYRTLMTASTSIVWSADRAGCLVEASDWEAFTGQAPGEFIGASWMTAVHPDDRAEIEALWRTAANHAVPFETEYRLRSRGKESYRYVRTRGAPLFAEDGAVREWIGTIVDIHARQEAQEALRRKEAELQVIIDAVPALLSYVDRDLRYGLVNQSYKRWFELPDKHLRGRTVREIIGPAAFSLLEADFARALAGEFVHVEKHLPYLRGTSRWVEIICLPDLAENGETRGFVGFVHDITPRKKIEQELADALDRYRFLAEAVPQLVWTARPDGKTDYFNRRWSEFTGVSLADSIAGKWIDAIHPDDRACCLERWERAVQTGEPYELEQRFRRASDGVYRWHLCRALPRRDENGKIVQWIGTCTDLDEQKQAFVELNDARELLRRHAELLEERVRERTANLAEANRELEAFSYSVSHDLRTPLQFVQGFSEAILDDHGNQLTPESQDYLRRIIHAASRMDTVIRDLLIYSRLSRAEMPLTQIALDEIVQDVLQNHRTAIQQANIEVVVRSPLPTVRANATGLYQSLSNLVANAIKFVSPDRPPRIVIHAETRPHAIRLSVEDNGIGIAPEYHDRIFRIFERLHGASQYPGTGIGLSLVRKAIDRMGGTVSVESELGRGSTFSIDFPR